MNPQVWAGMSSNMGKKSLWYCQLCEKKWKVVRVLLMRLRAKEPINSFQSFWVTNWRIFQLAKKFQEKLKIRCRVSQVTTKPIQENCRNYPLNTQKLHNWSFLLKQSPTLRKILLIEPIFNYTETKDTKENVQKKCEEEAEEDSTECKRAYF